MTEKEITELKDWKRTHYDSDRQECGSKAFDEILSRAIITSPAAESMYELAKRKGLRLEMCGWLHRPDNSVVVSGAESPAAIRGFLDGLPDIKK